MFCCAFQRMQIALKGQKALPVVLLLSFINCTKKIKWTLLFLQSSLTETHATYTCVRVFKYW